MKLILTRHANPDSSLQVPPQTWVRPVRFDSFRNVTPSRSSQTPGLRSPKVTASDRSFLQR
ncbi:MAG: hypothetical protein LR011_09765 [Verrucomicrobia bacterium]|nr:hypothetical protein [Verrucomicrobiota bacterium]